MTILKTDTVSGIGNTDGTVFEGDITFDSLNYMTLPKGTTQERGRGTRGVFVGAGGVSPTINTMDYINIQSTAHALDFGDATGNYAAGAAASSSTRGLHFAGFLNPAESNVIDYFTIASTTRAVFGGTNSPSNNAIEYVSIMTTGNATDFGDLEAARSTKSSLSNAHGGL